MNENLEALLYSRYPALLANRRGFACGDGWFNLINDLCAEIQAAVADKVQQPVFGQVKEKFGELRVHFGLWNPHIDALIELATVAPSSHVMFVVSQVC